MADYISNFTGGEIDRRLAKVSELEAGKQDKLVSGENIKTVGGQSLLGEGNIPLTDQEAVKFTPQTLTDAQKTQARTNIGAAAAAAISALETAIAAKYSKPSGGIPETDLASGVQSALALARTSIQSLANYYSKTEVDALLDAVGSEQYVDVTTLPTASASTLGKIYLVGPDANGFYDRYYTSYDGSTYSWVAAGNTEINLANYATKSEVSQLRQEVGGLNIVVDCTQFELQPIAIPTGVNPNYATGNASKGIFVPLQGVKTIHYKVAEGFSYAYIAFVTSGSYLAGEPVPMATGYNQRIDITAGIDYDFDVPSDATFLYAAAMTQLVDRRAAISLKIDRGMTVEIAECKEAERELREDVDETNEDLAILQGDFTEAVNDLNARIDAAGIVGVYADQINGVSALGTPMTVFATTDGAASNHDNFAYFETYLLQVSPSMLYMYYEAVGTDDLDGIDPTDASAVTHKAKIYFAYCDLANGDTIGTWHRGFPAGVSAPYAGTNRIKLLSPTGAEVERTTGGCVVKIQGDSDYPYRLISGAYISRENGGYNTGAGTFMWKSADGVTFDHCVPIWKGYPDGQISAIVRGDIIKCYARYRDPDTNERQIGIYYITSDGVMKSPYHHFFGNDVYGAFASVLDARREILFPTSLVGGFHTICYIVDGAAYQSVALPDNFTEGGTMRWPYVASNGLVYDPYTCKYYVFWTTNNNGHGVFGYDKPMYIKCREITLVHL